MNKDYKGVSVIPPQEVTAESILSKQPNREKPFLVADIRDLQMKVMVSEISHSRMVEILNEMAYKFYKK